MFEFKESGLTFRFDQSWHVVLWDKHPAFVHGLQRHQTTCGVDFLALHGTTPWFIEVKSFREHRIENKDKFRSGELAQKIAGKVRDTIAGLVWAMNRGQTDDRVEHIVRHLFISRDKFRVVFWLEEDPCAGRENADFLIGTVKQRLAWMRPHVFTSSRRFPAPVPGLTVEYSSRPE